MLLLAPPEPPAEESASIEDEWGDLGDTSEGMVDEFEESVLPREKSRSKSNKKGKKGKSKSPRDEASSKLPLWIGGGVATLLIVSMTLYFVFRNSGDAVVAAPEGSNPATVSAPAIPLGGQSQPEATILPPAFSIRESEPAQQQLEKLAAATIAYEEKFYYYPFCKESDTNLTSSPRVYGTPQLSWRVHLLPFLGEQELYSRFHLHESWESPHNKSLLSEMPDVYRCPGDAPHLTTTRLQLFMADHNPSDLLFIHDIDSGQSIRDGRQNTLLLAKAGPDKAVPWTAPRDMLFDEVNPMDCLGMIHDSGIEVVTVQGVYYRFPRNILPRAILKMVTANDDDRFQISELVNELEKGSSKSEYWDSWGTSDASKYHVELKQKREEATKVFEKEKVAAAQALAAGGPSVATIAAPVPPPAIPAKLVDTSPPQVDSDTRIAPPLDQAELPDFSKNIVRIHAAGSPRVFWGVYINQVGTQCVVFSPHDLGSLARKVDPRNAAFVQVTTGIEVEINPGQEGSRRFPVQLPNPKVLAFEGDIDPPVEMKWSDQSPEPAIVYGYEAVRDEAGTPIMRLSQWTATDTSRQIPQSFLPGAIVCDPMGNPFAIFGWGEPKLIEGAGILRASSVIFLGGIQFNLNSSPPGVKEIPCDVRIALEDNLGLSLKAVSLHVGEVSQLGGQFEEAEANKRLSSKMLTIPLTLLKSTEPENPHRKSKGYSATIRVNSDFELRKTPLVTQVQWIDQNRVEHFSPPVIVGGEDLPKGTADSLKTLREYYKENRVSKPTFKATVERAIPGNR